MSIVINFAAFVEIVLFNSILTVVRSAVGVRMLPSYSSQSPPTHKRTCSGSYFVGLWVQTIFMYVTFSPAGTLERGMKKMVFVPLVSPYPCDSLPSSLHIPASHFCLYCYLSMRCLYSNIAPVVSSITALTIHCACNSIGISWNGSLFSVTYCFLPLEVGSRPSVCIPVFLEKPH